MVDIKTIELKATIMNLLNIDLYKKMYLIRRAEEKIREHYLEDEMKTPMHMSMGEEAIVAGVCHALKDSDQVLGTYRSHALYLAKTMETDYFFAEMYGKATGIARGKSGSMHLSAINKGLLSCSAIVASNIPVAVGVAFANRYKKNGKKVAVFFGDGALDEGVFWESLNSACMMKLPVIFVCEDNDLAVHTHRKFRTGYDSICDVVSKFHCNVFSESTTEVNRVYNLTLEAIRAMDENQKPCFMHFRYYRYLEHVGINEDFDAGYRTKEEYFQWLKKDPIYLQRATLIEMSIGEEYIKALEKAIDSSICQSIERAKNALFSDTSEIYEGVFKCE
ncbi:MAG: thiamine pyrophosphate-dependent dehydrogenase E1 component subunit alpha [Desulfobacterales bacterium]|nr:thiamine pyrophosphate-dependent dehydrogenase E1 component subunit alpha [Desulfobacterales bacterium]